MGTQSVSSGLKPRQLRLFENNLLQDVRALEYMQKKGMFETGVSRIGAEQELVIIDKLGRPSPVNLKILDILKDEKFTTELGVFNLEFNLDPLPFSGDSLRTMEKQLVLNSKKVADVARQFNSDVTLVGILPTLLQSDLTLDKMTPKPRYKALNDALSRLRGSQHFESNVRGIDELYIKHDNVMLEAANTSFQVHFQVSPEDFSCYYNVAQLITGPMIAIAANSPIFLGKRLWQETRIALFQQSIDTRTHPLYQRHGMARVSFGTDWVRESAIELFKEDITRFRVMLGLEEHEDAFEILKNGGIPNLKALQMHNSTIYRWNRPCYGITGGKPHYRIENRVFPSGPTPLDEVANASLWLGLINQMASECKDISVYMNFDDAKGNLIAAAREGLGAQFKWLKGKKIPVRELILEELLPMAEQGLRSAQITEEDINYYLGIINERVKRNQTGAEWMLTSFSKLKEKESIDKCLSTIVLEMAKKQKRNQPVHTWKLAKAKHSDDWRLFFDRVEQYMVTDLFTVNEDDSIELVVNLMEWRNIHHVPVENNDHELVGMLNFRTVFRLLDRLKDGKSFLNKPVKTIMMKHVRTVKPETTTYEALNIMLQNDMSCLPVLNNNLLVGLVTEHDFMKISAHFLQEKKQEDTDNAEQK
ncbi:CBS domain-containing protein [candidate division KSB1 bacterium]|nr:CBS domain-containing protein [candidate division KSB1 bacterium]